MFIQDCTAQFSCAAALLIWGGPSNRGQEITKECRKQLENKLFSLKGGPGRPRPEPHIRKKGSQSDIRLNRKNLDISTCSYKTVWLISRAQATLRIQGGVGNVTFGFLCIICFLVFPAKSSDGAPGGGREGEPNVHRDSPRSSGVQGPPWGGGGTVPQGFAYAAPTLRALRAGHPEKDILNGRKRTLECFWRTGFRPSGRP